MIDATVFSSPRSIHDSDVRGPRFRGGRGNRALLDLCVCFHSTDAGIVFALSSLVSSLENPLSSSGPKS